MSQANSHLNYAQCCPGLVKTLIIRFAQKIFEASKVDDTQYNLFIGQFSYNCQGQNEDKSWFTEGESISQNFANSLWITDEEIPVFMLAGIITSMLLLYKTKPIVNLSFSLNYN